MKTTIALTLFVSCLALAGCENKQAALQAEYKAANKQYYDDCIAPASGGTDAYFKGSKSKPLTPQEEAAHRTKCDQELKRTSDLQRQISAASK